MIVLDTHVLVWAVAVPERLSKAARSAIRRAQQSNGMAIAAITLWELAVLITRGRIQAYGTLDASLRLLTEGLVIKPITTEIATLAAQFPSDFPSDPADRLIAATALADGMALVTRDERLRDSRLVQTIW